MTWKVCGDTHLPLAGRNREWDGDAAAESMFRRAGWDDDYADPDMARQGFFAYDDAAPKNKTSYKLPFAAVIDGRLRAVPRGIFSVAQVLEGARGGVDLPDDVIAAIRRKVAAYYHKLGEEPPWKEAQHKTSVREKSVA